MLLIVLSGGERFVVLITCPTRPDACLDFQIGLSGAVDERLIWNDSAERGTSFADCFDASRTITKVNALACEKRTYLAARLFGSGSVSGRSAIR